MWCDYNDRPCINPFCLGGCVDLKNRREYTIKQAEKIAEIIKAAQEKSNDN